MNALTVGLVLVLSGAALAQQQPPNLVPNGDMELDEDGDGMADNWAFAGNESVKAEWARDKGADGGYSQRLTCTAYERTSPSSHAMLCQVGTVRLEKGKTYRLTCKARAEGIRDRAVQVAISDMDGWQNCGLSTQFIPTREWRSFEFDFRASRTVSKSSRLQFWYTSTGRLWLDDVVLTEAKPRPRRYTEVVADMGGKNKVPNSSFECGTAGWGSVAKLPGWGGGLNDLVGELDGGGVGGGKCLKIALSPKTAPVFYFDYFELYRERISAVAAANRGWIDVKPGEEYVLSAFMRSEPAGVIGTLAAYFSRGGSPSQSYALTSKWQRVELPLTAKGEQVYVAAGLDLEASKLDAGTVWIDDVQLEAGTTATEWAPRAPVEVGIEWPEPGHLFSPKKPPRFTLNAYNAGPERREVEVALRVTDFFDREAATQRVRLTVPPKASAQRDVVLSDVRARGAYRVAIAGEGVAFTSHLPERFAVIDPYTKSDSAFGMNHAYSWDYLNELSGRFGLRWFRDWSLKWQFVEPEPGKFDFTETDYQINRVLKLGINVLPLLPFPSSNWASSAPEAEGGKGYPANRERMAWMPKDLDAFAAYVRRTVTEYKDRLHVWEIMNEPVYTSYALPQRNGYKVPDYVRLLEVAYKAVKAADPQAKVIGGIAGGPTTYTKEFIEAGGLEWVDIFNLHTYPGLRPPELYDAELAKLRKRMADAGHGDTPIWFTEGTYYADDDPAFEPYKSRWMRPLPSEREAGINQVKFDAVFMAYGVTKFIYHSGTCGSLNQDSMSGVFFEWDGAPRKMVATQAALSQLFGPDVRSLGKLTAPEDVWAYAFTSRGRTIIVVWNDTIAAPRPQKPVAGVRYEDVLGNPIERPPAQLTEVPLYLVADRELSAERAQALLDEAW